MSWYQTLKDSVAVVTRPRKKGCVLVTQGKTNQRDERVKSAHQSMFKREHICAVAGLERSWLQACSG